MNRKVPFSLDNRENCRGPPQVFFFFFDINIFIELVHILKIDIPKYSLVADLYTYRPPARLTALHVEIILCTSTELFYGNARATVPIKRNQRTSRVDLFIHRYRITTYDVSKIRGAHCTRCSV